MTTLKKLQRQLYNKQLFLLSLNLGCFEDKDYYTNWYEEQLQKFKKYI